MSSDLEKVAASVVQSATEPVEETERISRRDLLSTGSTVLNLAISGNPFGGLLKGKYYLFVGDTRAGKTFLALAILAQAVLNRHFAGYRLIYDNVEDGCLFDLKRLFNEEVAARVEPPGMDGDVPVYSSTVEEFYYHLDDAVAAGTPFIYVLDSMDALSSTFEQDKFDQHKEAYRKGTQAPGSYGDGKAKKNSEGLRKVMKGLRDLNSILVVICQTRDELGMGMGQTRSGGRALSFYATVETWFKIKKELKRTVRGKERPVGVRTRVRVRKNRITGKTPEVELDIYPSCGLDDVGTCVDYLVSEGWWSKKAMSIVATEFAITATREKLIRMIEEKGLEKQLQSLVGKCWRSIEEDSVVPRKNQYTGGSGEES